MGHYYETQWGQPALPPVAAGPPPGNGQSWNGGHLIAYTYFGPDTRYNLVPQLKRVNTGLYKRFENAARACLIPVNPPRAGSVDEYSVTVNYFNDAAHDPRFPQSFDVAVTLTGQAGTARATGRIPWDAPSGNGSQLAQDLTAARIASGC
ncbi:DNA/RNA non-specific endonuclease [Kitasatospora sp. NPDC092039]|uniref:DNA/RNA non-specific endonuclease n=1 Tax=Kitasatospora sp. NPDC092039 TaxID=3364086 RepID=UPI00381ADD40